MKAAILVILLTLPAVTHALNGGTTYPKILMYTSQMDQMTEARVDSLSRADVLVHLWSPRPEAAARAWRHNPDLRILMELQPQYVVVNTNPSPWWKPDTLFSMERAMEWECFLNPQWLMRNTSRQLVGPLGGGDYLVNWTMYCPVGTRGSGKGLRASQWYAKTLASMCLSGRFWKPMSWDAHGTLNGVVLEIFADCLGSYGHLDLLSRCDPDNDGVAEGVSRACMDGGDREPLSAMMRGENAYFRYDLFRRFPADFVFVINENNDAIGPSWRTQLSGMKLENWDGDTIEKWRSWMYGAGIGRGYEWAEDNMGRASYVPDSLKGWDVSVIRMRWDSRRSTADNWRRHRLAMTTALLGYGFYYFDPGDEKSPAWPAEFSRDLGLPTTEKYPQAIVGTDTLWARQFQYGTVRVNPTSRWLLGVPPHDGQIR